MSAAPPVTIALATVMLGGSAAYADELPTVKITETAECGEATISWTNPYDTNLRGGYQVHPDGAEEPNESTPVDIRAEGGFDLVIEEEDGAQIEAWIPKDQQPPSTSANDPDPELITADLTIIACDDEDDNGDENDKDDEDNGDDNGDENGKDNGDEDDKNGKEDEDDEDENGKDNGNGDENDKNGKEDEGDDGPAPSDPGKGDGDASGGLPVTGAALGGLVAAAVAAIGGGGAAFWAARRRRGGETAETAATAED